MQLARQKSTDMHPLKEIASFFFKMGFMNNQFAEKTLGEHTWYMDVNTKVHLKDLIYTMKAMAISYDSNITEWACNFLVEIIENSDEEMETSRVLELLVACNMIN